MNFVHKLERLMRIRGETQRSLAAALELSHRAVGGWLSGSKPRGGTALLIAEHFSVPVDDLLDDSKELPLDRQLGELRGASEKVQSDYPENPEAQENAFDLSEERKRRKRAADGLRKVISELASIAYDLDTADDRLHRISQELKDAQTEKRRHGQMSGSEKKLAELKARVAASRAASPEKERHHA